jgi:hypothetical protein
VALFSGALIPLSAGNDHSSDCTRLSARHPVAPIVNSADSIGCAASSDVTSTWAMASKSSQPAFSDGLSRRLCELICFRIVLSFRSPEPTLTNKASTLQRADPCFTAGDEKTWRVSTAISALPDRNTFVRLSKTSAGQIQTLKTQKLKERYLLKKQTNPDIKAQALAIFCR